MNLYAYVGGNPINFFDIEGLDYVDDVIKLGKDYSKKFEPGGEWHGWFPEKSEPYVYKMSVGQCRFECVLEGLLGQSVTNLLVLLKNRSIKIV